MLSSAVFHLIKSMNYKLASFSDVTELTKSNLIRTFKNKSITSVGVIMIIIIMTVLFNHSCPLSN